MNVEVLPSAESLYMPDLSDKAAIVIDVLRATSTMVTALANGCHAVIPVREVEEARDKQKREPGTLLGGERKARRITGFDLGNSPFDYTPEKVSGKKVIMTTTNGTKAIQSAVGARRIWIASFLNVDCIAQAIRTYVTVQDKVHGLVIICAGTEDRFDLPDTICAGMLIEKLGTGFVMNDLGYAAQMLYNIIPTKDLPKILKQSRHGMYMLSQGMERDIDYCASLNTCPIVPVYDYGEIIVKP